MAFIDKFIWKKKPDKADTEPSGRTTDTVRYAIIDAEIGLTDHKIHDIAALRHDGAAFHKTSRKELLEFLKDTDYICGHNINTFWKKITNLLMDKLCSILLIIYVFKMGTMLQGTIMGVIVYL